MLLFVIREKGDHWTQEGQLQLTRANGTTTSWPVSFEENEMILEEYENETHRYTKAAASVLWNSMTFLISKNSCDLIGPRRGNLLIKAA